MPAEAHLPTLLREIRPVLNPGAYVFCTALDRNVLNNVDFVGVFQEAEGWTVVLAREVADELGLSYSFVAAWITLTVHSDLEAVGLTAAVAQVLVQENIPCNVVAGFYHDHIFVPIAKAAAAMEQLHNLMIQNE
jgi:hypothetical protein